MIVAGDREDEDEGVERSAILRDIAAGQAVPDGNSWSSADGGGGLGEGLVVIRTQYKYFQQSVYNHFLGKGISCFPRVITYNYFARLDIS